jgi:3-hydroxyisobutyrate dehydrogenase
MKLGFIGLGIMGESMAQNLVKKSGETVIVFDFNEQKVEQLVALGAVAAKNSKEVVQQADVIFTSVPKAEHVKAVHESVYDIVRPGQIFIDMSTISPYDSVALANKLSDLGAYMLDAPVVKSKQAAIDGLLGIYVGGKQEIFIKVEKYLACIGSSIEYLGANGKGAVMKICHNMLVGQIQNGVNEMMTLAAKFDVNWEQFQGAIAIGGAKNFYLETKAKAIGTHDFQTAFSVENMYKDVTIARELINEMKLELPGTVTIMDVYQQAMDAGFGGEDFSASVKVIENLNK